MPDRDNVIKRLEECLSASCRGFRTCPYSDDEWDAVKTVLALLREMEAVEPDGDNCVEQVGVTDIPPRRSRGQKGDSNDSQ